MMNFDTVIGYNVKIKKGEYVQVFRDIKSLIRPVIAYQETFKQTRLLPYKDNLYKTKLKHDCINIIMKYVDIDISKREIDVFVY
jgi:hypothetical protein